MSFFVIFAVIMTPADYLSEAVRLLRTLIATPSVSRDETRAADIIASAINSYGISVHREGNNVWAVDPSLDTRRPTLLLNAHLDTVKPVASWTRPPFTPQLEGDRLYGLGANDCGGGLVCLLQTFRRLVNPTDDATHRNYNLVYLASAEEEVSGAGGVERALPLLPPIDVAVVGEPTTMQPAVAEKGLLVLDVTSHGRSGHAARGEGVNAIYQALDDLLWLRSYRFQRVSPLLGPTLMQVTVVHAGTQHNVVPDRCDMTVDVRTNELYDNREVFRFIDDHLHSDVRARSLRLHSSHIDLGHPLVRRCIDLGLKPFGSPTLSDQALMPFPSLKLGPGDSARSHAADEYIGISEMAHALDTYYQLFSQLRLA